VQKRPNLHEFDCVEVTSSRFPWESYIRFSEFFSPYIRFRNRAKRTFHGAYFVVPVNGSSAPRCVYMSHVSSAEFCDSNVDLRGVSQRELPTVKTFSWEFFDGAKRGCKYTNSVSTFDFVGLLT